MPSTDADPRRSIPRTDTLMAAPEFVQAARTRGRGCVKAAIRDAQNAARAGRIEPGQVADTALHDLLTRGRVATTLRPVCNATGVVLHTNLGRARLSSAAREALTLAGGYCDVEFDLAGGTRDRRGRGTLSALAQRLPQGTGALVVNNGAAAIALVVAALAVAAARPDVVISRGELVEIGDGFRIPDLLESTGARLSEVGTTNRTSLLDYTAALGPATGCVLKVHPSNFRIHGFTRSVPVDALAVECSARDLPLVVDIGSGLLTRDPLLPDEPDATTTLQQGATIVTASCDKLLGGPQGGLVLGDPELVERVRRHPLARAMRVDKTSLAALEATLRQEVTPTAKALHARTAKLRSRAERLAALITAGLPGPAAGRTQPGIAVEVVHSQGAVGGGCAPGVKLPGWAVALPEHLAGPLRVGDPSDPGIACVVGRLEGGRLLLDVRALTREELPKVAQAVCAALVADAARG